MQKKTAVRASPSRKPTAGAPQRVRIIGGQWKRTPLAVLSADGLRPTPDRVRETVFNWLDHLFAGEWQRLRCLDLFAGSGALGFEAASRGAAQVTMVDAHGEAVRQMEATRSKLKAEQVDIVRGDAASVAQKLAVGAPASQFDLIFLDPPYQQDWLPRILPACPALLRAGGLVYVEAEYALDTDGTEDWRVVRADRAGTVFYHLLERKMPT